MPKSPAGSGLRPPSSETTSRYDLRNPKEQSVRVKYSQALLANRKCSILMAAPALRRQATNRPRQTADGKRQSFLAKIQQESTMALDGMTSAGSLIRRRPTIMEKLEDDEDILAKLDEDPRYHGVQELIEDLSKRAGMRVVSTGPGTLASRAAPNLPGTAAGLAHRLADQRLQEQIRNDEAKLFTAEEAGDLYRVRQVEVYEKAERKRRARVHSDAPISDILNTLNHKQLANNQEKFVKFIQESHFYNNQAKRASTTVKTKPEICNRRLCLGNRQVGPNQLRKLLDLLSSKAEQNEPKYRISHLDLSRNELGDEGVIALSNWLLRE